MALCDGEPHSLRQSAIAISRLFEDDCYTETHYILGTATLSVGL